MKWSNRNETIIERSNIFWKEYNYGMAVLKMIMCFEVILYYFGDSRNGETYLEDILSWL